MRLVVEYMVQYVQPTGTLSDMLVWLFPVAAIFCKL